MSLFLELELCCNSQGQRVLSLVPYHMVCAEKTCHIHASPSVPCLGTLISRALCTCWGPACHKKRVLGSQCHSISGGARCDLFSGSWTTGLPCLPSQWWHIVASPPSPSVAGSWPREEGTSDWSSVCFFPSTSLLLFSDPQAPVLAHLAFTGTRPNLYNAGPSVCGLVKRVLFSCLPFFFFTLKFARVAEGAPVYPRRN